MGDLALSKTTIFIWILFQGVFMKSLSSFISRYLGLAKSILILFLVTLFCTFTFGSAWAAGTAQGEIEKRPAPVFRRVCVAGTNAGNYCKQDSECPGSTCANRNVFNITVAVLYDAPTTDITAIENLITAGSAALFDVTDGQAEIGQATIHNNAISSNQADLVIHPSPPPGTDGVWWQALTGFFRNGGFMEVSIDNITDPGNQGYILAHEFTHLVFDARDEYENRQPNCGAEIGECVAGVNAGNNCTRDLDCPGSTCGDDIGNCPDPASGEEDSLMNRNGTEFCWGQGNPADLTDLSGGNHDPTNETEQSSCRDDRSVWDQVVWSWPTTFLKPAGAPDPEANGAVVDPVNFVVSNDAVRVVLVLDESGSMDLESPTRMERLKVAANDFIATAENDTELGIVSYASDAETTSGRVIVPIAALGNNRTAWTNAVNGLNPSTRTNIGDGLQESRTQIMTAGGVTANTYIVLMTDGLNNEPQPQASADANLQEAIDDLLDSGIPVYVTCTGGDLGLQSQCAEIASGTNGFNADSANAAQLPENFVDFHERITGYQIIDSFYGNFANIEEYLPRVDSPSYADKSSRSPFFRRNVFVDQGSESVSFTLLWEDARTRAILTLIGPDGKTYQTGSIPQGQYVRIDSPKSGDWQMIIHPVGYTNSDFVARAYTHNKVNNFIATLRKPSYEPNEEIYVYAFAKSVGGTVTKEGEKIIAEVTRPDGAKEKIELLDNGRDATGQGDDMAGDGIFTGVYKNTVLKGAYGFRFQVDVDRWSLGNDIDSPVLNESQRSPRFSREVRLSAAVSDPNEVVTKFEDDRKTTPADDQRLIKWLLIIMIILQLITILLIWFCCCYRGRCSLERKQIIEEGDRDDSQTSSSQE